MSEGHAGDVPRPVMHVCTTCLAGQPPAAGEPTPGARLHEALAQRLEAQGDAASVELRTVSCLAGCSRGCTAAIRQPGKWAYLLGGLDAALADDLLAYAAAYRASGSGAVLPSRRPASLRDAILGRFPAIQSD